MSKHVVCCCKTCCSYSELNIVGLIPKKSCRKVSGYYRQDLGGAIVNS